MNERINLLLPDPGRRTQKRIEGRCWLGCDPEEMQAVTWIGPVTVRGVAGDASAAAYACDDCINRIYGMARADQYERDLPAHLLAARPRGHP
ncbi:hypothetical protein [Streptomyces sp. SBT349]|uniref:hypothetical protein n=1 Tax=Streptomyces sp. SBT349 TaxID=1580539 RepID=UPI00066B528B|nr:hypothetical protein [Streptomyces sp. SBT349]